MFGKHGRSRVPASTRRTPIGRIVERAKGGPDDRPIAASPAPVEWCGKEDIVAFGRIDAAAMRGAYEQMRNLETYIHGTGLERSLLELVKIRASQINGCAFCLSMHTRDALKAGEREDRLAVLPAWRETDWFSDRERAALAWGEAVTTLEHRQVPDEVFAQARAQFSEKELADLTLAVVAINGWNRFNVAFHGEPDAFEIDASERAAAD
jgi:AhpD family alkylhydroperoxidase